MVCSHIRLPVRTPLSSVNFSRFSVSAELLWSVADWAQRGGSGLGGARGGGVAEVLSLESVDGIEVCKEGSTVLDLYSLNVCLTGSNRRD